MKVLAVEEVELFGEKMIAELVEYKINTTYTSIPFKPINGENRYTIKRKIRLVPQKAFSKLDAKGVKDETN